MSIQFSKRGREVDRDERGNILMTPQTLKVLCLNDELYEYPELNEKLYLHFKGFGEICNLEAYCNVKTLWLENNAIREIKNLECLPQLTFLFLQQNFIPEIKGLENAKNLVNLNLSNNKIRFVSGLRGCLSLQTLNLSSNILENEGVEGVVECPSLTNLDLSNNQIKYQLDTQNIFQRLPHLVVLTLRGNDYVRECSNYRKTQISSLPNLKHLDERPITFEERRLVNAWIRGGVEGETAEREILEEEKREKQREYVSSLRVNAELRKQKQKEQIQNVVSEYEIRLNELKEKCDSAFESEIQHLEEQVNALKLSLASKFSIETSSNKTVSHQDESKEKELLKSELDELD